MDDSDWFPVGHSIEDLKFKVGGNFDHMQVVTESDESDIEDRILSTSHKSDLATIVERYSSLSTNNRSSHCLIAQLRILQRKVDYLVAEVNNVL